MIGVFSSVFVHSAIAALEDTQRGLQEAVGLVLHMLIVLISSMTIRALKTHASVEFGCYIGHFPESQRLVAVRHRARAVLFFQVADAWSAVVLLAVFFHGRLHRDTVTYAALHRFDRNRCSARLGCNRR